MSLEEVRVRNSMGSQSPTGGGGGVRDGYGSGLCIVHFR